MLHSEERSQSEGEIIAEGGAGGGDSGVASGGADAASSTPPAAAAAPGGKGKKKGKRSRHGHKEEAQRGKTEVAVKTNRLTQSSELPWLTYTCMKL